MSGSIIPLLGWRDFVHLRQDHVRGDADSYCTRAAELRELVTRTLSGGLNEASEEILADIAGDDIVDFCILVDFANDVDIPDVDPLDEDTREWLSRWVENDPWRSLAIDTDISVCVAMLRAYGKNEQETIWHMSDPHLLRSISRVFDAVDREQYLHFVGEINALHEAAAVSFDSELIALTTASAERAAERLGIQQAILFN